VNAGWYTDPMGSHAQRYWDGSNWTNHLNGAAGPSVDGGVPSQTQSPIPLPLSMAPAPPPSVYGANAPYVQPGQLAVAPKNPAISLLISFFLPGVGSLVNGDTAIGLVILIGWLVSWVLTLVFIGFLTATAFWIWGMIDAYKGAQRWNLRRGIMS
jgi:TM2 domain-containing membrane protein YozV